MGYIQVRSIKEMVRENKRHFVKVRKANTNTITMLGKISMVESKEMVSLVKYKGTLLSSIRLSNVNKFLVRVVASAPHAYAIEKGEPARKGFVSFNEEPALKTWCETKLMAEDPNKASYFLHVLGGVFVGEKGFPYRFPNGLRFMESGWLEAIKFSDAILNQQLSKI